MRESAYMIPKRSRLYTAAVVCMILQFAVRAGINAYYVSNHIPFFGNLFGDTQGFFAVALIDDILYFAACALPVPGIFLARKNLWFLSVGWLCSLLLQIWQNIIFGDAGTVSFNSAAVCALVLILVQTGNIRSRKAAVIPFMICGAVYLAVMLPSIIVNGDFLSYLSALIVLEHFSCAMLTGSMLWRTDVVHLPEPIVEKAAENKETPI